MLPTPPSQQPPFRSQTRTPGSGQTPLPASIPMPPMPPMPIASQTTPYAISQQQTMPQPAVSPPGPLFDGDLLPSPTAETTAKSKRKLLGRIVAIVLLISLAIAIYLSWHITISTSSSRTSSAISQQNFSSSASNTSATSSTSERQQWRHHSGVHCGRGETSRRLRAAVGCASLSSAPGSRWAII